MKTWKEVTQDDYNLMKTHHRKADYNADEANQVFMLVKTYINPHVGSCFSCGESLRDAKTQLNEFYLLHKHNIELNLSEVILNDLLDFTTEPEEFTDEQKIVQENERNQSKMKFKEYNDFRKGKPRGKGFEKGHIPKNKKVDEGAKNIDEGQNDVTW